jgi:hypothetical protein
MTVEITIAVPESLVESAKRLGEATQRDVALVLAEALELLGGMWDNLPAETLSPSLVTLTDAEVLSLARSKMDEVQNRRLGELQARGKVSGLAEAERYELLALLQIYQLGQLRKSEGLAEAVRRGLMMPLPA